MIAIVFLFIFIGMFCISLYFVILTLPIRRKYLSELGEHTQRLTTSQALSVSSSESPSAIHEYHDKDLSYNYIPQEQFAAQIHSTEQSKFVGKPILLFDKYVREHTPEELDKKRISYHHDEPGIIPSINPKFQIMNPSSTSIPPLGEESAQEYKVEGSDNYDPSAMHDLSSSERSNTRVKVRQAS